MAGTGDKPEAHCRDVIESMYLFLDEEELTADQRTQVRDHLDECIPCLESYEFETELKQVIRRRCSDDVPAQVYESVRAKLSVEIESNVPKEVRE